MDFISGRSRRAQALAANVLHDLLSVHDSIYNVQKCPSGRAGNFLIKPIMSQIQACDGGHANPTINIGYLISLRHGPQSQPAAAFSASRFSVLKALRMV